MSSWTSNTYGNQPFSDGMDDMFDLPRSWWSFEPGLPGSRFGKIGLSIRVDGAAQPLFAVDVDLFSPQTPTAELVRRLDIATTKDRCAIWRHTSEEADNSATPPEKDYPEACFWTLWYRHYTNSDPPSARDLLRLRRNVRGTSADAAELVHLLHILFSIPSQHVITRLSEAMAASNVEDILKYGPICVDLFSMLDDYDAKFCKWMHREVVLQALGLYGDMDDGTVLWTHSMLNEWQERLEFAVDDFKRLQASAKVVKSSSISDLPPPVNTRQSLPLPPVNTQQVEVVEQPASPPQYRARQTTSPSISERHPLASPTLTIDMAELSEGATTMYVQEVAGERNGPPPPSPLRRRTGARAIVSEHNPEIPSSPVLRTAPVDGILLSPSSICERPLNAEIYYEIIRPHSINLLTRLYEGFLLPANANEAYMPLSIKEITAEGSDAWIESEAWKRDISVRRELGAVAEDIAYPVLGIYRRPQALPIFASPWSSAGNITQYIAKQPNEDSFDNLDAILDLMIQLLRVVAGVHAAGIVHGNIKGNNVLVTASGELRLCGFGAYRTDRSNVSSVVLADEHAIVLQKSEMFMSPELRESGCPTMESDMWAVSCVCIEMYLARHGYLDAAALMTLSEEARPHINLSVPQHVWDLLEINWSLVPSQRLSAQTMYVHLMALRSGPTSSRT